MITLKNVTLRRGAKVLLDGASRHHQPRREGRPGGPQRRRQVQPVRAAQRLACTKTAATSSCRRSGAWAQVAQDMPETDQSATDFVVEGDTAAGRPAGSHRRRAATTAMAWRMPTPRCTMPAPTTPPRAQALILGLGFKVSELDKPVNSFSGGWRMRLQLARALMCPSDLLLLDEPTNHLDLDALVWLEAWLKRYEGTMIVISHDREFLDAVTASPLHIDARQADPLRRQLQQVRGHARRADGAAAGRLRQAAGKDRPPAEVHRPLQGQGQQGQAGAEPGQGAGRMEKIGARCWPSAEFTFEFKEPANLPNPMLAMQRRRFGYPAGRRPRVRRRRSSCAINRSVLAGQRIGILGANGQGKSTLVKTIARACTRSAAR
jgi:ATP-binding cassette subfamily F protein 3